MQQFTHYFLHLAFPLIVAYSLYRKRYWQVYGIFLLTMLVDLDHLLANPIFDPNRCSIGFHPLHSYWAIGLYCLLLLPARSRVVAIGLLMHMATDWLDCCWQHW
jgi:hypothetical protein